MMHTIPDDRMWILVLTAIYMNEEEGLRTSTEKLLLTLRVTMRQSIGGDKLLRLLRQLEDEGMVKKEGVNWVSRLEEYESIQFVYDKAGH